MPNAVDTAVIPTEIAGFLYKHYTVGALGEAKGDWADFIAEDSTP